MADAGARARLVAPVVQPRPRYVCASRRDFTKHVFRPAGTKLRVVATLNGRTLKSKIGRKEIRIRVDLRGEPKATYTLRVAITRTRPDGKRITTVAVEQIDYHTCIPTAKPSYCQKTFFVSQSELKNARKSGTSAHISGWTLRALPVATITAT